MLSRARARRRETDLGGLELPLDFGTSPPRRGAAEFEAEIAGFREFGTETRAVLTEVTCDDGTVRSVRTYVNEFWTAQQRQAHSLHEISYRACFKPQLPRFFIDRLTVPGEVVYDPFGGRGTTLVEAALLGRVPYGCDINPLSRTLVLPRLSPPTLATIQARLEQIPLKTDELLPSELLVFYHPDTLEGIVALRRYLLNRVETGKADDVDRWIALVTLNRLTGHSNGFLSVYTLPPNQAVSVKSQAKINERRKQRPEPRDIVRIILKKSRGLLKDCTAEDRRLLGEMASRARLFTAPADCTPEIRSGSVSLVVTSPPFLTVVQYATDNWLRCWFLGIDPKEVRITMARTVEAWQEVMRPVFCELHRVLKPGGHIAFEVGEVHSGATKLEEAVVPCGISAGLEPVLILINDQEFTKTANCWGISNMARGTNSNRIVLFRKHR